jgi:hypothetical protein
MKPGGLKVNHTICLFDVLAADQKQQSKIRAFVVLA